jgi:hypothetical protein
VFNVYVLFLILSGGAMLGLAGVRKGQVTASRIYSAVLGAAFLGYGLYLLLFFQGGHYLLFYYVFVVPIVVIARFFRSRSAYRMQQQMAAQAHGPYPTYASSPFSPPPYSSRDDGEQPGGYGTYPGQG